MVLLLLEHVNFKIPFSRGKSRVEEFYVKTLGCPECETGRLFVAVGGGEVPVGTPKQMHVNLGLSQIHFEWCTGDGRPYDRPQRLKGCITLAVDDVSSLKRRLETNGFPYWSNHDERHRLTTTDPFGNTFVCVEASSELKKAMKAGTADRRGLIRAGGVGNVLALLRLDFDVRPGLSAGIARFYADRFGARINVVRSEVTGTTHAEVMTENAQIISFNETASAPPPDAYDANYEDAIHFCIYISDFRERAEELKNRFWVNPDYRGPPLNDNVADVEGATARRQFRMKNLGERGEFILEHEVRGTDHPLFPKL